MGGLTSVIVPAIAVAGGVVIALAKIVTNNRQSRGRNTRLEDKVHHLEMQVHDMQDQMKEINQGQKRIR